MEVIIHLSMVVLKARDAILYQECTGRLGYWTYAEYICMERVAYSNCRLQVAIKDSGYAVEG